MKRIFIITVVIPASFITVLYGTLFLCVNSSAVQRLVISRVNRVIPGEFTLGSLHLSLFKLSVELRDVSLADSSGRKLAGIKRLLVAISLPHLLQRTLVVQNAVVEHPWAVLEVDSGGHLSLLGAFPQSRAKLKKKVRAVAKPFQIEVRDIGIVGGKVFFAAPQDSMQVHAYGFSVAANGATGSRSADATVAFDSVDLERNSGSLHLYDLALTACMRDMNLDTVDVWLRTRNSTFTLHGKASGPVDSPYVNIHVDAAIALAEVSTAAGLDGEFGGIAEFKLNLRGRAANPDLDLTVVYDGGRVAGYPVDSLSLTARLNDRVLTLMPLHVTAGAGRADVCGDIDARGMFPGGFLAAQGSLQELTYSLAISGEKISLKKMAPGMSGTAAVSMALDGHGVHPDSFAATLGVSAHVTSLQLDTSTMPLDAVVACSASVERGTVLVRRLTGMLGSTALALTGRYRIPAGEMDAAMNVAVPALDTLSGFAGIDSVAGSATISAHVKGDLKHPQAAIGLSAAAVSFRNVNIGDITFAAELDRDGTARVKHLALANKNSQVQFTGSAKVLENGAPLPVDRMTFDCSLVSPRLFIGDFIDSIEGLNRSGSAALSAHIKGDLKHPQAIIDLNVDSIAYRKLRIGNIALGGGLEPDGTVWVKRLELVNGTSAARLAGSANILENGALVPVDRIVFDGSFVSKRLVAGDFIDSVEGTATIDAQIKGTVGDLRGYILLSAADLAAAGQRMARIDLDARFEGQRASIQPLRIVVRSGQDLTLTGWATLTDSFAVALSVPGIHLNTIAALAKVDSLDGMFSMDLQVNGTYTRPEAHGKLGVRNIRMGAAAFDDVGLHLDLRNQQLEVTGTAAGDLHAGYNIDSKAFMADLTFNNFLLTPYLALSGQQLDGALTAEVKVSGTADSITGIAGSVHIAHLFLGYKYVPIIETHDLNASLENTRYTVPDFNILLAGEGKLKGHAHGLLEGPHDASLSGTVPLTIIRHFTTDFGDIEGNVGIDAFFKGTAKASDLKADVRLNNIGMTIPGLSQRLHSLNGRILADPKALKIETLQGNLDDGVFAMNGEMALDELAPSKMRANITLDALPVGIPDMLDMVLNARLRIAGTPDTAQVTGNITLLDGLYYQDVVINPLTGMGRRQRKEKAQPAEITMPYLRNMRFDVGVRARSPLRVDDNLAQLTIAPDLQLTGTFTSPSLYGRADVEQGTITYLKRVFTVERGVVDFVNPYAIEPRVDIKGTIPVQGQVIQIALSGSPDDLVFTLSSDNPAMEDQDILSLLILGRTTAELQSDIKSGDAAGQSNQQMIASLVASTFGENIKKAAGLDVLEVETGSDTSGNSDRIAVTVGKQLTKRLGTKYTVESEAGQIIQRATAEYRILQDLFISGFQDTRGVYGGELRFKWEKR